MVFNDTTSEIKYFIENDRSKASYFQWIKSKGTNYTCYMEYLKELEEEKIMNNKIEQFRTVLNSITAPFSMPFLYWTLIVFIIYKLNYHKPVMKIMEDRETNVKNQLDDAKRMQSDAKKAKMKYQEQLKSAEKDGELIIKDAKLKAQRESEEIIQKTKREAQSIILEAKRDIEIQREQMIKEVRTHVVDLAILAASKLMEVNLGQLLNMYEISFTIEVSNLSILKSDRCSQLSNI